MKVSEITTEVLIDYCNAYPEDTKMLEIFKEGAISYIKNYTGIEDLDKYEDITLALLVLINESFENKSFTVESNRANKIIESILNMHSINLL